MRQVRLRAVSAATLSLFVTATIALSASPASAAQGYLQADFDSVSNTVIPAHAASSRTIVSSVSGYGPYSNAVVTFDFAGLADVATASMPAHYGCTTSGTTAVCPIPDSADDSGQNYDFDITVTSVASATNGATGSLSIAATADNADSEGPNTTDVTISDAPELDTNSDSADQNASPGDAVTMPLDLANLGSEAAPGVQIIFDVSHGIAPATYDNCIYASWTGDNGTSVACTIPGAIAVNHQATLHGGFKGTIVADSATFARIDAYLSTTSATSPTAPTGGDWTGVTFAARPHAGQSLTLDAETNDGSIVGGSFPGKTWAVDVDTTNDIAAIGTNVTGHVGDTVNATLGFKDLGPAALDSFSSHDPVAYFEFTVPTWATAVTVPSNCSGETSNGPLPGKPGLLVYQCSDPDTYVMSVGDTFSVTIGLKITSLSGTDGTVAIYQDGTDGHDPNSANNIEPVTLTGEAPVVNGDTFVPLTPTRILDTRSGLGAPKARVSAGGVVKLKVAGVGGVPASGVTAVVMNVTAVAPSAASYITVYPDGQSLPAASNLNVAKGQTLPNLVTVPVINGTVDLRNAAGAVDLLADVTGYYTASGTGSALQTLDPTRILDTRSGLGAPKARVNSGGVVKLKVAGVGGVPSTGVTAVVMNVTAVNPAGGGFLTVYPDGQPLPTVSNLNFVTGKTVANLVIVPVINGTVDFRNSGGTIDLLADVTGYFSSGGYGFHTAGPVRLMDTRSGAGVRSGPVGPGATVALTVVGADGVPAVGVTAVVLNVTAVQPTGSSYLTVFPDGDPRPTASDLNFASGQTIANLVVVPVVNGKVDFYNSTGSVQVLADLDGYFTD